MAQYIKQGDIFGRIGSELGKGLSEQIPKEVERSRLSSGLRELSEKRGLNPVQQFAELAAVPGAVERPQLLQTYGELLKQQALRDAYARGRPETTPQQKTMNRDNLNALQFAQGSSKFPSSIRSAQQALGNIPQNLSRLQEAELNQPSAAKHPLSSELEPASPWTQEKQEQAINEAFDTGRALTFDQANEYANQQRQFYEQAPEKYRKQLDYRKEIDREVEALYDQQLQTRLQKEGTQTFQDVPGDLQLNIKKEARNSVATGKMTPQQAAEYYSKKSLDLVQDRNRVLEIANRDALDRIWPSKKEETIKNLISIGKSFSQMGSSEDFYNLLRNKQVSEDGRQLGMGLSPGGAAVIAFQRSPPVKKLINDKKIRHRNATQDTLAFVNELSKVMSPSDSLLGIARIMKQKDKNFDEYAFFDYLRDNKENFSYNPRLGREIDRGVADFFPDWRDIGLFPAFGRSIANE